MCCLLATMDFLLLTVVAMLYSQLTMISNPSSCRRSLIANPSTDNDITIVE